jgi:hypothetical protein
MKKKREIVLCLVCLMLGWIQPATADLIGWWPFEDGSGTIAKDATDNKADALVLGDPVWDKNGQHGDALLLDGDGDYAYVEGNYSLPLYSVGMWFRVDGGTAERDLLGIYADELAFGILLEVGPMAYFVICIDPMLEQISISIRMPPMMTARGITLQPLSLRMRWCFIWTGKWSDRLQTPRCFLTP